jgi:hypothetical protein
VAAVYYANASTALTDCVVHAKVNGDYLSAITVIVLNGAGTTVAFDKASARDGAAAVSGPIGAGGMAFGVGSDWDGAAARTLLPGQTMVSEVLSPGIGSFWTQRLTQPAVQTGSVTVGTTAPTDHRWNLVVAKIPPA